MTEPHNVNISSVNSNLKTIGPNDSFFTVTDGMTVANRAGFKIDQMCPKYYKMIIVECINKGWLEPIATVYEHELTWEILNESI